MTVTRHTGDGVSPFGDGLTPWLQVLVASLGPACPRSRSCDVMTTVARPTRDRVDSALDVYIDRADIHGSLTTPTRRS